MSTNMSPTIMGLEAQLVSIMDTLAKAAVAEICQLFSSSSAAMRLQISQSLKENEMMRTRMRVMRSELFSLRLQARTNLPRPASRISLARANIPKPRMKPHGSVMVTPILANKPVRSAVSVTIPLEDEDSSLTTKKGFAEEETSEVILIKDEEDVGGSGALLGGQDNLGNHSTRDVIPLETPDIEVSGSSFTSGRTEELRIVSVHGRGEGPLAEEDGTLFSPSELQALSSMSSDHNIVHDTLKSFNSGPNERPPIRGNQANGAGLVRENQPERNHVTQLASTSLKCAVTSKLTSESSAMYPSHSSHTYKEQNSISLNTANRLLECNFCFEQFSSREDLILHRASHTGETSLPCGFCGKLFVNKTTLGIHMRIHTGEKPYLCSQCGKGFTQSGSLKIHLRTHSGEKPYTCSQCKASFNNPSNLRRHMSTHSGQTSAQ